MTKPKTCATCEKLYTPHNARGKFCSSNCKAESMRKHREAQRAKRLAAIDPVHKRCTRCGTTRLRSDFRKDARRIDGLYPWCIDCWRAYIGARAKQPARLTKREYDKQRRERAKQELGEARLAARHREKHLQKFNLTVADYNELLAKQGGRCAICRRTPLEVGATHSGDVVKALAVDHDHSCCPGGNSCGECVRGLLCTHCNSGLGMFRDQIPLLMAAATYLTEGAAWSDATARTSTGCASA